MKVAVMGAGAIGSLFGGLLADSGNEVTLIGRDAHVRAIQKSGLNVKGFLNRHVCDVKAETNPDHLRGNDYDLILLTVKAYDVRQAALQVKPLMKKDTPVLCLQNGIGVEDEAVAKLGKGSLLRGVTFCGAIFDKPGEVLYTGFGDTLIGKPYIQGSDVTDAVAEVLEHAGFPSEVSRRIDRDVWMKTLVNAGINPLGTLMNVKNGELVRDEDMRELMVRTVSEGVDVAVRLGIKFDGDPVERTLRTAEATSNNLNSMLQDIRKGKRTEIEYINGAISRLGRKTGLSTPLNRFLMLMVKSMEKPRMEAVPAYASI